MKTADSFRGMHLFALTGKSSAFLCVSRGSRAEAWKAWKKCGYLEVAAAAEHDGPLHDNKKFITRYGNGATVSFRLGTEALL